MKTLKKIVAMILLLCLLLSACAQIPADMQEGFSDETAPASPEQTKEQEPIAQPETDPQAGPESPQAEKRSAFEVLPVPEVDPSSNFGVDINVNISTIDQYLNLDGAVYRDMRMPVDPYDYAAIGGNSLLTGMLEGFTLIPYPYLAPCQNMPAELGEGYSGPTLFSINDQGNFVPNYKESVAILEQVFPKDQAILLMCGAGGYASMTKALLVNLGWDENLIYNIGGYWFYEGTHNIELIPEEEEGSGVYLFEDLDLFDIDFARLTPVS